MVEQYWLDEIHSYDGQWCIGPDDKHEHWKWREFLKMANIMRAESKCKERMKE